MIRHQQRRGAAEGRAFPNKLYIQNTTAGKETTANDHCARKKTVHVHLPSLSASVAIRFVSEPLSSLFQIVSAFAKTAGPIAVRALFITRTDPKKQTSMHETRRNMDIARNNA